MYASTKQNIRIIMDQSDIKYIIELLVDAIFNEDWDTVEEAKDTLKEFLDSDNNEDE